jgi:chemotaxis protein MotB
MKRLFPVYSLFIAGGLCCILPACVTKRKFLASESRVHNLESDSTNTHRHLTDCDAQVKKLQDENASLAAQNEAERKDLQNAASKSKMTIAGQAKRLKDLQDLIQSQRDVMNKLRKSIADALVNFKPDELSVYIKDGNVYVSLQEKLLFKSGSAVVDPKGKEALGTLAIVLNTTSDVSVMIEGHTDTVPIKNEKFQDNWALSVARATAIVRILTRDYQLDPHRITASGRGEFHPVADNSTAAGKTSNRRTEIILSPNLSELYKLLGRE